MDLEDEIKIVEDVGRIADALELLLKIIEESKDDV